MADTLATFLTKPIYCRATEVLPIKCLRADGSTPIPLSGATLKASMSRGSNVLSTWAIGSGISVTDTPGGLANLSMTSVQTDVGTGNLAMDVVCIEADGTTTIISGTLQFVEHATR